MTRLALTMLLAVVVLWTGCSSTTQTGSVNAVPDQSGATPVLNVSNQPDAVNSSTGRHEPGPDEIPVSNYVMAGTWRHTRTTKDPGEKGEPLGSPGAEWTFKANGTGSLKPAAGSGEGSGKAVDFKWEMSGNDITVSPTNGDPAITYSIVGRGENDMVWRNGPDGDYFIVEKR